MTDFRNLQHYLSQLCATPTAEEYYLEGYSLLRTCASEAQTILQTPFSVSTGATTGDPEREKQQLKTSVHLFISFCTFCLEKDRFTRMTSAVAVGFRRMLRLTSEHRIITDAAVRRFQCQRAYLRAHAGLRWVNSRHSLLRGQQPNASHLLALQQVDGTLRNVCQPTLRRPTPAYHHPFFVLTAATDGLVKELLAITDTFVGSTLRTQDAAQGKWLAEDPSLSQIQQQLMRR